jgi:hypothetical protein
MMSLKEVFINRLKKEIEKGGVNMKKLFSYERYFNPEKTDLPKRHINAQITDTSLVSVLGEGTSTLEESDAILTYCIKNNI